MSKSCWIIGASHGIGEALAKNYHVQGYNLILSARNLEKLEQIKSKLNSQNSTPVLVSKVDVCDRDSLAKACDEISKNYQKIDLIIFCSALYQPASVIGFDLVKAREIIEVNLVGVLNLFDVIIPKMVAQKSGQIGIVASVAGYRGLPNSFTYGASKAALINMCEGIYPELKRQNIDISVINPGFVKTRLTDQNTFSMPFIITPEKAAEEISKGLAAKKFEIHFPKKFTFFLKLLRILPYPLFFFITKKIA
ncbi:MAG: SDR family NAD(P)-dependent oxidoreductase [Proteobacteria bacterium]|nr:SDR family NAD(P)-dependent oxidoreductase [Pseudomonadota bacterium]